VVDENSQILILGTLPGDESIRLQRYYGNSRNQLWTILEEVFQQRFGGNYEHKLAFLKDNRIALWDVLQAADRVGSSDRRIVNARPNDFGRFFIDHPSLRTVVFNGGTAEKFFKKYVSQSAPGLSGLLKIRMPSTSPTPGKNVLNLDQKIDQWKAIFLCIPEVAQADAGILRVAQNDKLNRGRSSS
jgi:hypoxanthine-DNA glycosylase